MGSHGVLQCHMRARQALRALFIGLEGRMVCSVSGAVQALKVLFNDL